MKKILFRADAKPSLGAGDLMSLVNLSAYFDDYESYFLAQKTMAAKNIFESYGVKNVFWLKENCDVKEDVEAINGLIAEHKIDLLFFEITERKLTDYDGLNEGVKKACVNFDGYAPQSMSLIVNWDIAAEKLYDKSRFLNSKFLLGSKYVILPKAFYVKEIQNRVYADKRKKVLIAMGGADELDFTSKVANALALDGYELTIIVGGGYEKKEELVNSLAKKRANFSVKSNVSDMLKEYMACDFAVGAGGLTSSELVASHTPCAIIATYEHQTARCEYFDARGWIKYLGFREDGLGALSDAVKSFQPCFAEDCFETFAIAQEVRGLIS